MVKQIIIFIGHPVGGKTSAAHKLTEKLSNSKVIEVDKIKTKISGSMFGKDDEERELWFKEINKQTKESLANFDNIIIDEGFFTQELFNKIINGFEQIKKFVVEITFELDEHVRRNEARGDTPEPIQRMYKLWQSVPKGQKIKPNLLIKDKSLSTEQIADLILKNL